MEKKHSRRDFISRTVGGAALLGINSISGNESDEIRAPQDSSGNKLKIVVTGGHPGDPEYGCGGTIARYTEMGHEVVLLYLNRGEGGINGKTGKEAAAIRTAEAIQACKLLSSRAVFATQIDGQSVVDAAHYREFIDLLDSEKPDIIFNQWPIDNHPDHRAISSLVYNAWVEMGRSGINSQPELYYYEVSDGEDTFMFNPGYYVDITAYEPLKKKACYAHASQSPDMFYSLQEQVSRFRGIECGCTHAEAFIKHVRPKSAMPPPLR